MSIDHSRRQRGAATPVTLERLLETVRVECPDLDLRAPLRLIEGFEKWIVVGDSWVARFPKSEAAAAAMGRERRLVNYLAGRTTAAIPRTLHVGGEVAFDVCTKMPGTPLWDNGHESWRMWPAARQARCQRTSAPFSQSCKRRSPSRTAVRSAAAHPPFPTRRPNWRLDSQGGSPTPSLSGSSRERWASTRCSALCRMTWRCSTTI